MFGSSSARNRSPAGRPNTKKSSQLASAELTLVFNVADPRLALDQRERPARARPARSANLKDPAALAHSVAASLSKARADRASAEDGPTFLRLRRAHARAGDAALKSAIRAALKLDEDCAKFFSPSGDDFAANIARAIEGARKENPGFLAETYELARAELMRTMK